MRESSFWIVWRGLMSFWAAWDAALDLAKGRASTWRPVSEQHDGPDDCDDGAESGERDQILKEGEEAERELSTENAARDEELDTEDAVDTVFAAPVEGDDDHANTDSEGDIDSHPGEPEQSEGSENGDAGVVVENLDRAQIDDALAEPDCDVSEQCARTEAARRLWSGFLRHKLAEAGRCSRGAKEVLKKNKRRGDTSRNLREIFTAAHERGRTLAEQARRADVDEAMLRIHRSSSNPAERFVEASAERLERPFVEEYYGDIDTRTPVDPVGQPQTQRAGVEPTVEGPCPRPPPRQSGAAEPVPPSGETAHCRQPSGLWSSDEETQRVTNGPFIFF